MERSGRSVFRVGELEVDTAQRVVRRNGEAIQPRARTFDLLVYLIERRDRIVSRQELLDALWPDTKVTDNSIMQCVNEARRSLDDDSRNPRYIRTVAKAGYQFIGRVEAEPMATPPAPVSRRSKVVPGLMAGAVAVALLLAVASAKLVRFPESSASAEAPWTEAAWWKLDEGGGTHVSDARNGLAAPVPAGLRWTRGISRSALQFPGPEMIVRGADSAPGVLPRGLAPRTLMAWIRTASTNGDTTVVFQHGDPAPQVSHEHFYLALHESGVAAFGSAGVTIGRTRVDDDRWHQLAGVFEGGERGLMRLYVDGVEEAALPVQVALQPARVSAWSIGRGLNGGTSFRGAIDDVRVFPRALPAPKIRSLHRCQAGPDDIVIGGRPHYFSPVYGDNVEVAPGQAGEASASVRHTGKDFGGAAFTARRADCALSSTGSADIGQDFDIEMELKLDAPKGLVAEGGPYFRSRRASPGDGLFGGTSAGFWVQLDNTGGVRLRRLHPMATIAFSAPPAGGGFDASAFHKLEASVRGQEVRVRLDGRTVEFDAGGVPSTAVKLMPAWESASPPGSNHGSAGVVFGSSPNRGQVGGQEARNIRVKPVMLP